MSEEMATSPEGSGRMAAQPAHGSSYTSPISTPSADKVSVIGPTLVFKGELEAGEDLLIQGKVEGSITHTAQSLTIGEQGAVAADIRARNIVVEGEVTGDMYGSESVGIRETAVVKGNVYSPRVGIDEGAHFKGGIDMDVKLD